MGKLTEDIILQEAFARYLTHSASVHQRYLPLEFFIADERTKSKNLFVSVQAKIKLAMIKHRQRI